MARKVLVTGATGFIGRHVVGALRERGGFEVHVVSRDPDRARERLPGIASAHAWDARGDRCPAEALEGAWAVIHLLGESIASGRWTAARKAAILESRRDGTRHLVEGIAELREAARPRVLVSTSAVGYYGDRGEALLSEEEPPGAGFLAEVCVAWEREAARAAELGPRVVTPRMGVVLGPDGGALAKMALPFKLFLGGRLGSGRQYVPWVHIVDAVGLLLHAAENDALAGPLNTTPNPCTNAELTRALAAALGRPALLPAPAFALRLVLGEMAAMLLDSQRPDAAKARSSGYTFRYTEIEPAVRSCLAPAPEHVPPATAPAR